MWLIVNSILTNIKKHITFLNVSNYHEPPSGKISKITQHTNRWRRFEDICVILCHKEHMCKRTLTSNKKWPPQTTRDTLTQWREEVWWCLGRLLDYMPPYQILALSIRVWWSLLLNICCLRRHNMTSYYVSKPTFWRSLLTQHAYYQWRIQRGRLDAMSTPKTYESSFIQRDFV